MRAYGNKRATLILKRGSCNPSTFEITQWDGEEKGQLMFVRTDGKFMSYPMRNISWYTVEEHTEDSVQQEIESHDNKNTIEK